MPRPLVVTAFILTLMLPALALSGSGSVNKDGTINLTLYFPFTPTQKERAEAQTMIEDASELLWNASEGQLRIGEVRYTNSKTEEELADIWMFRQEGRSNATLDGLTIKGGRASMYYPWRGGTLAHELGHLALGLQDEYSECKLHDAFGNEDENPPENCADNTTPLMSCGGRGQCIDDHAIDARNNCIMQDSRNATEFCVPQNHDLVQGDGASCPECRLLCEAWSSVTRNWETTVQEAAHGCDCWTHISSRFDFLQAPTGLPSPTPPPGFPPPPSRTRSASLSTRCLF